MKLLWMTYMLLKTSKLHYKQDYFISMHNTTPRSRKDLEIAAQSPFFGHILTETPQRWIPCSLHSQHFSTVPLRSSDQTRSRLTARFTVQCDHDGSDEAVPHGHREHCNIEERPWSWCHHLVYTKYYTYLGKHWLINAHLLIIASSKYYYILLQLQQLSY